VVNEPSLEELYEDAPCGYLSFSGDGSITRANRTFLCSMGVAAEDLVGVRRLQDLMTPGSRLYAETHWWPSLELAGELREMPVDLVRSDGTTLSVLLNATRFADGIRASLFDATDRRRYERELIASRDLERAARERVERLQQLTSALAETSGIDAISATLGDAVFEALEAERCAVVLDGRVVHERSQRFPDPDATVERELPLAVADGHDASLVVVLPAARAVTEDEQAFLESCAAAGTTALRRGWLYAQMEHQALHDPVTGLPNRRLLDERLAHEVARSRRSGGRFAVVLLGLAGFKLLNDSRSHAAGDEALRLVAARLAGAVRETDLVARLGGDEFAVVSADLGSDDEAGALAQRLASTFDEPLALRGGELFLRAGIGVSVAGAGSDPAGILGDADVAMAAAKRSTNAPYVPFDTTMRERMRERVRVEAELRTALRDGDLRVFYQPIVRAEDSVLTGMEALVRWEHPQRGLVSPGVFIPVAEECGLIVDVGRYVLQEATRQLGAWRAEGLVGEGVGVTVNVSARQLEQPELVGDVTAALAAAGLADSPWLLGLELTESMLMQSADLRTARLGELAAIGVRLLLDDFGTGASSLARLRRFPIDTLKVDRAFVSGLGVEASEDEAIVAAIVALASALDLDVVAEGVETPAQLHRLRVLGAAKIQGYLFSRPLPAGELRALLAEQAPAQTVQ
jgi:diguanylate cyclase (GGDEF)-like protein/PAS domain S-box-containing protein